MPRKKSYEDMTVEELVRKAKKRGIRTTNKRTGKVRKKSGLIRALRG